MEEQKLFVEMTIRDGNNYITARCPDEDDEMSITIKNKYKVNYMLTLQEAEDLADFLIEHVKNARLSNGEALADSSNDNSGLNIADVNGWLSIKECAALYGEKVKCKWLSPDGNDWFDKTITVNANFLREMEQGSIKEACR